MLKVSSTVSLSLLLLLLTVGSQQSDATLSERLVFRRQTESEQETTTAKIQGQEQPTQAAVASNTNNNNNQHNNVGEGTGGGHQPPRLYPDLAHMPAGATYAPFPPPPFAPQQMPSGVAVAPYGPHYPPNHGPTPFVPFGMQSPTNRLNALQHRLQPRPAQSPSERLQSETFTHGLGRRLLSMMGLDMSPQTNETNSVEAGAEMQQPPAITNLGFDPEGTMKALQNATVLQQLSKGVQSIYGGLSKMYNSTVQQQLDLLQERFKKETENSTNPWQQRMAQQVPMFFKSMAMKVEEAQGNLNRIWRQVTQASNGSIDRNMMSNNINNNAQFVSRLQPAPFAFSPDQIGEDGLPPVGGSGNFFNQIGRQFGFGGQNSDRQESDFGSQMMNFWHNQVQPQIGMVRGQVARVWRDLTASGMYPMDPMVRSRQNNNLGGSAPKNESSDTASSDVVDDILKSVDLGNSEYTLIEPQSSVSSDPQQKQAQANNRANELSAQFQNRLVAMQRELNQLWSGLSSSIQGALGNVKNALNPRPQQFNPLEPMASDMNGQAIDPAQNEIGDKIKVLSKLQRDADIVYDTVQKQQAQQRPSFTDRFRNFIGNVDFGNVDQLSDRIGESMSRFGSAVGDLWHQIPTRWDNFMQNVRQPGDQISTTNGRLTLPTAGTTQKPVSTSSP